MTRDSAYAIDDWIKEGYSFNDVLLVPQYSDLESRTQPDIGVNIGNMRLQVPVISSPMDTVTEANMASFMWRSGGLGIIHRYNSISEQYSHIKWVVDIGERCGAAVGVNGDSWDRTVAAIEAGASIIVMDVAHGHNHTALERAEKIKGEFPHITLVSPNVATYEAARDYIKIGIDALRVGIGPGSACTTRLVAGVGVPQITAIALCRHAVESSKERPPIISDGGIKNSGDIVKALAAGATAVMVGGLFAPYDIAAGPRRYVDLEEDSPLFEHNNIKRRVLVKQYRGMASSEALSEYKKGEKFIAEGQAFEVPVVYDYKERFEMLRDGIYAGFSYLGALNIEELWEQASFIRVSSAGYFEGTPHHGTIFGG